MECLLNTLASECCTGACGLMPHKWLIETEHEDFLTQTEVWWMSGAPAAGAKRRYILG